MNLGNKTKAELVEELRKLKRRNAFLEKAMLKHKQAASERTRAKEALKASRELVETIIETTPT